MDTLDISEGYKIAVTTGLWSTIESFVGQNIPIHNILQHFFSSSDLKTASTKLKKQSGPATGILASFDISSDTLQELITDPTKTLEEKDLSQNFRAYANAIQDNDTAYKEKLFNYAAGSVKYLKLCDLQLEDVMNDKAEASAAILKDFLKSFMDQDTEIPWLTPDQIKLRTQILEQQMSSNLKIDCPEGAKVVMNKVLSELLGGLKIIERQLNPRLTVQGKPKALPAGFLKAVREGDSSISGADGGKPKALPSGFLKAVRSGDSSISGAEGGGRGKNKTKRKTKRRKTKRRKTKRRSNKKRKDRKRKRTSKENRSKLIKNMRGGGILRWFQIFFISLAVIIIVGLCIADITGTSLISLIAATKATVGVAGQSAHIAVHTAAGHSAIAATKATAISASQASSAAIDVGAGHILNTVAIAAAVASFGEVLFKQIDKKQRRINDMVAEREQILGAERRVADIERPLRERDIKVAVLNETVQKLRMELNTLKTGAPIEIKPAEDFICPISQYIMEDPVTIGPKGSRQTYDKLYIELHFASGKQTDPLTNQELNETEMQLVPNDTLKTRIDVFKQKSKGTLLNAISQRDVGNIKESEELLKAVITMGIDEDSEEAQKILDEISGLQLQLEPAPAPALEEEEEDIRTKVRHERMGMSSRVAADRTGSRVPLRPQPPDPWSKESLKAKGFGASVARLKDKKDKTPQEQITYDVIIERITKTEGGRRATKLDEELREEERSKRISERQQLLTPGSDRLGSETHGRPDNVFER